MPTGEQLALWAAIGMNPADDTPRLVYADWLEEHGDPERAEFIRIQCRLALPGTGKRADRKERKRHQERADALLAANKERWTGPLRKLLVGTLLVNGPGEMVDRMQLHRGFVTAVYGSFRTALRMIDATDGHEPVDYLEVGEVPGNYRPEYMTAVARWSYRSCVSGIMIPGATDDDVRVVLSAGRLTRLQRLMMYFGSVSDAGAVALAASPLLEQLSVLELSENAITDRGAIALAQSPYLTRLQHINLLLNPIGPAGAERLLVRFGHRVSVATEG